MKTLIAHINDVVPRGMKVAATVVFFLAVACGGVLIFLSGMADTHATAHPGVRAAVTSSIALVMGTVVALWLLALGYIYADAKRRSMPPVLWLAIVIIVPNMIGFILYFALRKPLLSACVNCGQGITPGQKFCPSCGREQNSNSSSSATSSGPGSISLNPQSGGLSRKSFATGLSVWIGIFAAKGIFMYWKHATVDAGGWFILAGICAWIVVALQHQTSLQPSRTA